MDPVVNPPVGIPPLPDKYGADNRHRGTAGTVFGVLMMQER
jgi:hypothetical protein